MQGVAHLCPKALAPARAKTPSSSRTLKSPPRSQYSPNRRSQSLQNASPLQKFSRQIFGRRADNLIVRSASEEAELLFEEIELDAVDRMDKTIDSTVSSFNTIRTGRANPAMLDRLEVEYYGAPTPLKSLAGVSVPDASTLLINPFDKGCIQDVEKAIANSDLGLTPNNDGEKIRLNIPQLTEDRRKEMMKLASKMGEEGKVAIRNIRRDTLKSLGKLDLGEDDEKNYKGSIQKTTDGYVKKIDDLVKSKEKDLSTI